MNRIRLSLSHALAVAGFLFVFFTHTTPLRAQNTTTSGTTVFVTGIVSNAAPAESAAIRTTLVNLQKAAEARDANALGFFGASAPADNAPLQVVASVTHIAVSPAGALVREVYGISIQRATPVKLASGVQELWLSRMADGTFALSTHRFAAPPDALGEMTKSLDAETKSLTPDSDVVVDLVASRIGGRWISLRYQTWQGRLSDDDGTTPTTPSLPRDWMVRRMTSAPQNRALTGHFLLQRGTNGWFGVGAAFNKTKRLAPAADTAAAQWRDRIATSDYYRPEAHRDFAYALASVGLWNETADELQKAELLRPGLVGDARLKDAEKNRARDPQNMVASQLQNERNVGLGAEHPTYLISALMREQQAKPNVLSALRLALEYSRLADDERADAWLQTASQLQAQGLVRPQDAQWVQLLVDHLKERAKMSKVKPTNILRSELFTARLWPDDRNAVLFLATLEEAQHTVYADFGIPMGNTEVLLWHNQGEFSHYTTQFSAQGGSEFVAALTLTKLVATRNGPLVLGEEINTFADTRDLSALFGTVAHEYGHVAVRQLSKGRLVPVWFNEGIATSVEGGYDNYIARVRRAADAGTFLTMPEMLQWDVDGERAFLAYSQANSLLDFIVHNWGKDAVLNILRQIGNDTPPEDAFQNVLGISETELWNRWVRQGIE